MGSKRVVVGGAILAVAALLVGVGVFAAFTDTESTNVAVRAGALDITGGEDITIDKMAPGDVAFRTLTIGVPAADNDGDLVQAIRVAVPRPAPANDRVGAPTDAGDADATPTPASLLSGPQGLRVTLASCSSAWTLPGAGTALGADANSDGVDDSAKCPGTVSVTQREIRLADLVDAATFEYRPADFGVAPTATSTFPEGSTLNLIAQFRLPREADNAYENASLSFDMVFEALQRAGVNR